TSNPERAPSSSGHARGVVRGEREKSLSRGGSASFDPAPGGAVAQRRRKGTAQVAGHVRQGPSALGLEARRAAPSSRGPPRQPQARPASVALRGPESPLSQTQEAPARSG